MTAHVTVRGYLGKDMQQRVITSQGEQVTILSGSIGSTHRVRNQETKEYSNETDWYQIEYWCTKYNFKNADEFPKGAHVLVEGQLVTETYTDKVGVLQKVFKIKANNLFLLAPGSGSNPNAASARQAAPQEASGYSDDPPPF